MKRNTNCRKKLTREGGKCIALQLEAIQFSPLQVGYETVPSLKSVNLSVPDFILTADTLRYAVTVL